MRNISNSKDNSNRKRVLQDEDLKPAGMVANCFKHRFQESLPPQITERLVILHNEKLSGKFDWNRREVRRISLELGITQSRIRQWLSEHLKTGACSSIDRKRISEDKNVCTDFFREIRQSNIFNDDDHFNICFNNPVCNENENSNQPTAAVCKSLMERLIKLEIRMNAVELSRSYVPQNSSVFDESFSLSSGGIDNIT